ncbi:MAG: glycosyltransferase family 4 protein [Pseudomonadota bacterium]
MNNKILHILSQRPLLTGSGITLDAICKHAKSSGWDQRVIVGVPKGDEIYNIGGIGKENIYPLFFETNALNFCVPGMSDVMPYSSTCFSSLDCKQIEVYLAEWKKHLHEVSQKFTPAIIHVHHIWLLASIVKDVFPDTPVVNHSHATGFRQMELCPHLKDRVIEGCRRNDLFFVLHSNQAKILEKCLNVPMDRIRIIGAGFNENVFNLKNRSNEALNNILYIGKYSNAKGLPWLLDAFENLIKKRSDLTLHIAGEGKGSEAESLRCRMQMLPGKVILHGQLGQDKLAALMKKCSIFVLPSFYEGLPLVLIEALACGLRLICTDLPCIKEELSPYLGRYLDLIKLPAFETVDAPKKDEIPFFVMEIEKSIRIVLEKGPILKPCEVLDIVEKFTWKTVFNKIENYYKEMIK